MNTYTKEKVMEILHIKSRYTLYSYEKKRDFPHPIKTHPTLYLQSAVDAWIVRQSERHAA